jgi:hypothetical protein
MNRREREDKTQSTAISVLRAPFVSFLVKRFLPPCNRDHTCHGNPSPSSRLRSASMASEAVIVAGIDGLFISVLLAIGFLFLVGWIRINLAE